MQYKNDGSREEYQIQNQFIWILRWTKNILYL